MRAITSISLLFFGMTVSLADGPKDNLPENVRPIPPKGVVIPESDRKELEQGVAELGKEIEGLKTSLKGKAALLDLLPDVQIFHNSVRYALTHDEFLNQKNVQVEIKAARTQLQAGMERASALKVGKAPWTAETGLIVRGYVSKIDGSVQPYGLVVPVSYKPDYPHSYRLDIWCHGRGENLTEVNFLADRMRNPGQFTSPNAFVLHPYGRYCNANKFAGEIDVLEAMDHVKAHYPIDDSRIVMRGFSMGGASCWQFAVHYPSLWCAAAPGAGFSETPDFLRVFQNEALQPSWYEKKLWHLYDCPDTCMNLFNCPTVAYSGEIDSQKQAADIMAKAMKQEGIDLVHIIGPKTGHSYHPQSIREINKRIDALATKSRNLVPPIVKFATYTLRYNKSHWVQIDAMESHWEKAQIVAQLVDEGIAITTQNISEFSLTFPPGHNPFKGDKSKFFFDEPKRVLMVTTIPNSDQSITLHFRKKHPINENRSWEQLTEVDSTSLRKRHNLQGPIDDAFMDRFIMVRPTGKSNHDKVEKWVTAESSHAIVHWRKHFRGEAIVKDDKDVSELDIRESNLILWGDPTSNLILAKIANRIPIQWGKEQIRIGTEEFATDHHVPVMIYPNPLNPNKYIVLNSGFTFREYDYLNNARQVPKLPDFAIIDINSPITSRYPGKIVTAGFFNEKWELPSSKQGQ